MRIGFSLFLHKHMAGWSPEAPLTMRSIDDNVKLFTDCQSLDVSSELNSPLQSGP
jgi:hypothetical protein